MKIILNNNEEIIEPGPLTIADLIRIKNFTFRMLVTKINGRLVKVEDRDKTLIHEGDNVVILHLISGG
jgi:thiamine biosynthesis protein ThiS